MKGKADKRNKQILHLSRNGHTHKSIADQFGISAVRVGQIIQKDRRKESKKRKISQDECKSVPRDFTPAKVCANNDGFIIYRWECFNPFCKSAYGHFYSNDAAKCAERVPVGDCIRYFSKAVADVQLAIQHRGRGE